MRFRRKPKPPITVASDPSASHRRKGYLRTPSQQLSRGDKLLREALHRRIVTSGLLLILIAGISAALLQLNSWGAWVVLVGICVTVVGVIIAVSPTRRA